MGWGKVGKRILVLCVFVGLGLAYVFASGCNNGDMFAPLCGLGQLMFLALGIGLIVAFTLVSLIIFRPWKSSVSVLPNKSEIFKFVITLLLAIPVCGLILGGIFYGYLGVTLLADNRTKTQTINNYSVQNFSESPVVNQVTKKYTAITVKFTLTAAKAGNYSGVVQLDEYFGHYMTTRFDGVYLPANTPVPFMFILEPQPEFFTSQANGPYYLNLDIWPVDPGSAFRHVKITGDKNGTNTLGGPTKYIPGLQTRSYLFTDFAN